jgi:hypothetical protein
VKTGFRLVRGLFDEPALAELDAEANEARGKGRRASVPESDATEGRGGCPARSLRSSPGGKTHWRYYASSAMLEAIRRLGDGPVAPMGGGTYSYYERRGDFLAVHRDVVGCDLALVTALTNAPDAGALVVCPEFRDRPLSAVRAAGRAAGIPIALGRGDTIVLLGGSVPLEFTPVSSERVVAIMCYRLLEEPSPG